jgi:hypothetical protein
MRNLCTCVCMYVCMHVCMDECIYIYICMYVCMYVRIYVFMIACMFLFMNARMCVCMCMYVYVCISSPCLHKYVACCYIKLETTICSASKIFNSKNYGEKFAVIQIPIINMKAMSCKTTSISQSAA